MQISSRNLYRGTLRLLLVLLHDFPDFLSEYYFTLCDVIPPRCIQLRNIILSAFPITLTLPDPNLFNLSHDQTPDLTVIPQNVSDFSLLNKYGEMKGYLDHLLGNRGNQATLAALKEQLMTPGSGAGEENYNLTLMNTVVMYIGVSSVAQAKARGNSTSLFNPTDPAVVTLQYLASNFDPEGMYLF